MANNILRIESTAIVFANAGDYNPAAANNLGSRTNQIDLTSVANGSARQSEKVDLGTTHADMYSVMSALEFAVAATVGSSVDFYWAPSPSGTAGTGNPGSVSGSDGAYSGFPTSGTVSDSVKQLQYIGSAILEDATGPQVCVVTPSFSPAHRYGSVIVWNNSGQAMAGDAVEMSVVFTPLIMQVQ